MSIYRVPRTGTRPDIAVRKLLQLGGRADLNDWMRAIGWSGTITSFERDIVNSLTRCHVVRIEAGQYALTQRGRDYAGPAVGAATSTAGQVAGGRYVPEKRALSVANMVRAPLARPGSFDYASIPSRMGDQRVPHGLAMPGVTGVGFSE